jgi:3-hydroxyacyl-[acyl-carrier-protein] dehydratase
VLPVEHAEEQGEVRPVIGIEGIQAVIPHRYPFLLIDQILECEPGVRAVGLKCVSGNEEFFVGHFPGKAVMPGVLIIEALAQTGAYALLSKEEFKGKIALFAGIDDARFKRQVVPGDVLRLEVTIEKIRGPVGKGAARAYVGDKLACEATLTFAIAR